SRITNSKSQEPGEVEQSWRSQRIYVVVVVEGVEHLKHRQQRYPFTESDRTNKAPVKREVLVVLPSCVAVVCSPGAGSDWLSGPRLNSSVELDAQTDFSIREEVELVPDVAVGKRIIELR